MRPGRLAGGLLALLVVAFAQAATAELPRGRGVLLPLQDRVGDAELVSLIESTLERELARHGDLTETTNVRAVLRALRIRNAGDETPDRLAVLADNLGVEWFFLPTLHEALRGTTARRLDDGARGSASEDGADSPQIVLSALVLRHDSPEIWWAGLQAASGRDGETIFGLGQVEALDDLIRSSVRGLVAEAFAPRGVGGGARPRRRTEGYLRPANGPSPAERVAVIPMDSVALREPGASAEVATAALFATLEDFGFKTLLPGLVRTIRQDSGQGRLGAASRAEWQALARDGGARWVATGTVETYRRGRGRRPNPWVAFSVRFLDAGDGTIAWLDGLESTGSETAAAFDRGRIYSSGSLAYEMMHALFGGLRSGSAIDETARGD